MIEAEEMGADLVLAAGERPHLEQGPLRPVIQDAVLGHTGFTGCTVLGHAARTEPAQRAVDPTGAGHLSVHDREVGLDYAAVLELQVHVAVKLRRLGEQDDTAHLLVQAVHHVQLLVARTVQDPEQRNVLRVAFRDRREPGWLVDRDEVGVFADNGNAPLPEGDRIHSLLR